CLPAPRPAPGGPSRQARAAPARGRPPPREVVPMSGPHQPEQPRPHAPPLCLLQRQFLVIIPRIETHARIWCRPLACPGLKEDFGCGAVALAWRSFVRLAERGKDATQFPSALATGVVRAVRSGRRLCGQERSRDAMSAAAQRRHGFRVEELLPPWVAYERLKSEPLGQRLHDAFEERLRDNTQTPVIDQVVFRIDFPAWLATLSARTRGVVDHLMAGEGTGDVARKFGLSPGRVSQLRRQFEGGWAVFCYDPTLA